MELEEELRTSACKHLGDAWMLAALVLESAADADFEHAAVEQHRVHTFGRWQLSSAGALGKALDAGAAHFRPAQSTPVFEPEEAGGLGAPVQPALSALGITAVGHFCAEEGGFMDAMRAASDYELRSRREREAWESAVTWLHSRGSPCVAAERPAGFHMILDGEVRPSAATTQARKECIAEARRVRTLPPPQQGSAEEWVTRLGAAFAHRAEQR